MCVCVAWAHGSRKKQPKSGIFRMEIMVEEHRRSLTSQNHTEKHYQWKWKKGAEPAKAITRKITIKRNGVDAFFLLDLKKKTHFVRFGWRAMTHTAVVKRDFAQNLFVDSFFPPEWEESNEKQGERERKEEAQQSSNVSSTRNNYVDGISFSPIVPLGWCIWKKAEDQWPTCY